MLRAAINPLTPDLRSLSAMLRSLTRIGASLYLGCSVLLGSFHASHAGTFTWANVTGPWSNPNNWTPPGAPTGTDPTDILIFGGDVGIIAGSAPNYTSTNDISVVPFVLNGITLQATNINNQPTDPAHIITGNALGFAGATANITQNGAGPITFNTRINFSNGLTFAGGGVGVVTMNRGLSGSGNITKTGTSIFRFGTFPIAPATTAPSENTWMGTLVIEGGTVRFNNNAESARTALRANGVTLSPGATLSATSQLRTGTLVGTGGSVLSQVATNNSDNEDIVITALDSGTFSGTIQLGPPTGTGNDTGEFTVRGPGTQVLDGILNIEKDVTVGGALVFAGTASLGNRFKGAVILKGGALRLDNVVTKNDDRLRNADASSTGLDVAGGGTLTLDGNATGSNETIGRLQLSSLAGGTPRTRPRSGHLKFDLVHRGGATVLSLQSYNRDATTAPPLSTVEFSARDGAGTVLSLGAAGDAPRVVFNSTPALVNSLLPSTGGPGNQTGWAVVRTPAGLAFATHGANGVAPVTVSTTWASSTTTHIENADSQTVTGGFSAASLRLVPTLPGQQITLNSGGFLNTTGIILTGGQDFEIAGPGILSGIAPRFIHVDSGTLRLSAGIGNAQSLAKGGAGILVLASTANTTNQQLIAMNQGTLRVSLAPSTIPGGELQFRGGVLEFDGGGTFTRALVVASQVAGPNTVNWSSSELAGNPAIPTNLPEDRGSGGFAAINGDATVDLGTVGAGLIRWEDRSFVQSGYALILGSPTANSKITLIDNYSLTSSEATVAYNAREIRVVDNPSSQSDRAVLSGVISGTIHNDLLKTGTGTLELTGTSTFAGAALIEEGALVVNGSISQSIVADIRSGGTLSGTGTVSTIILEDGGTLAPGNGAVGTLTGTSLTWRANGVLRVEVAGTNSSDLVNLGSGALLKGSAAGPFSVDFGGGGSLGQSYTIVSFGSTDFAAADFTATNLAPGVTGSFQISAGNLLFVTDAPPAPEVVTGNSSNVGITTATVEGTVNPRGGQTTARVEYGPTTEYGSFVDVTPAPGSGIAPVPVSVNLTNLQPNTLYHFRLAATNAGGTTNGGDQTFTTLVAQPPVVTTGASSNVGATSAMVAGVVNPNGTATTGVFEYGLTTAYGSSVAIQNPGDGIAPVDVSALIEGLQPGVLYHYRLVATNLGGQTLGDDATFTTSGASPMVVTGSATNILDVSATLNGTVNPNTLATTAFFEYGLTTAYGQIAAIPSPGSGTDVIPVSANITGLLPSTTYHFRLVAENGAGTSIGDDVTFNTAAQSTAPEPGDDSIFVTKKAVTVNVLANDVNPETGDSTGLIFDGITVPPQFGTVTGEGTLTYTPNKSFPVGGDSFTYRVRKDDGQTATAVVSVRSFSAMKGSFATTIEEDGPAVSDTGSLTVTLSSSGKCSAKLIWERKSYALKGSLSADGAITLTKPKIGAPGQNLTLTFDLQADGTAPGTVTDAATAETHAFSLTRAAADSEGLQILPGVYNAWLPSTATIPGTGYVSLSVNNKRKAKIVGRLGDGSAFSDSSSLFGHQFVLDPLLYKSGKTFAGQLRSEIEVTGGQTLGTEAEWFKDFVAGDPLFGNGIGETLDLQGEKLVAAGASGFSAIIAALGSPSVQLVLEGGNLAATQTVPITLSEKKVSVGVTTLQKLSVKLDSKKGLFSGSFVHPVSGKKTSFSGAFRVGQNEGRGSFAGVSTSGNVRITATP
jgi:autotransporter-associated beta strand protein